MAVAATLILVLAVVGAIADAVAGEWLTLLALPIALVVWFWIAGGAWKRTTWGSSLDALR